jgi:hypothetical protein
MEELQPHINKFLAQSFLVIGYMPTWPPRNEQVNFVLSRDLFITFGRDCATAHAVSRRLPTAAARV